jgi:hypothetical protein
LEAKRVMKKIERCDKCQSKKIIPQVQIVDKTDYNVPTELSVVIYENPDAWIFKGEHKGILKAWICGDCGYTEIYLENPQDLYEKYQDLKNKR